jgi:hypothetical protein
MQTLVGDAQRFGLPFDPYAQPAQYTTPIAPPPGAVPYGSPMAPPPLMPFPALPASWGGFYAGFEATILEAHGGNISEPVSLMLEEIPIDVVSLEFIPDTSLEFSPRVWAGYKGAAGFGVRARWWLFDHGGGGNFDLSPVPEGAMIDLDEDDADDDSLTLGLRNNLKVNAIDLEGTQDGEFHNWDFQIAGGVRYATIDYDLTGTATGTHVDMGMEEDINHTIVILSEFEGVGPTVSMAARRPLLSIDGLAFLTNLRLAFLFGDSSGSLRIDDAPSSSVTFDELVQVWEVQVGFEYSRQIQSGARLFGAAMLEAQVWEWNIPIGISGGDLGFFGPTVVVGIAR